MRNLCNLLLVLLGVQYSFSAKGAFKLHPEHLTTPQQIAKFEYPVRSFDVKTDDGYIIQIHNIPDGKGKKPTEDKKNGSKRSVLLLPGVYCSSYFYFFDETHSLALYLADNGWDVWVGDFRGQAETDEAALSPSSFGEAGWFYSQDEIAKYDVPAFIDLILAVSGNSKLSIVGHSFGNTIVFQTLASIPKYNDKVDIFVALAPAVYVADNTGAAFFLMTSIFTKNLLLLGNKLTGEKKLQVSGNEVRLLAKLICELGKFGEKFCQGLAFKLLGKDHDFPAKSIPLVASQISAVSYRSYIQYYQSAKSGRFAMYDMGSKSANQEKYKKDEPPLYNLKKVTAPVVLLNGKTDQFNQKINIKFLNKKLPNIVESRDINATEFSHVSFVVNKHRSKLVNEPVLNYLANAGKKH